MVVWLVGLVDFIGTQILGVGSMLWQPRFSSIASTREIFITENIKAFCEKNNLPFEDVELAWLNYKIEKSEVK